MRATPVQVEARRVGLGKRPPSLDSCSPSSRAR